MQFRNQQPEITEIIKTQEEIPLEVFQVYATKY